VSRPDSSISVNDAIFLTGALGPRSTVRPSRLPPLGSIQGFNASRRAPDHPNYSADRGTVRRTSAPPSLRSSFGQSEQGGVQLRRKVSVDSPAFSVSRHKLRIRLTS
jgi:hypothetical protein